MLAARMDDDWLTDWPTEVGAAVSVGFIWGLEVMANRAWTVCFSHLGN